MPRIQVHGNRFRALVSIWTILSLAQVLQSCGRDGGARIVGPSGPPSLLGQWKGTVTAVYVSGNDTLSVKTYKARLSFDSTTFSYRYVDDYGYTVQPYVGSGTYDREGASIYLHDTTTYDQWVDRSTTPIIDEPYTLSLSHTSAILRWHHDYDQVLSRTQCFDLIRDR